MIGDRPINDDYARADFQRALDEGRSLEELCLDWWDELVSGIRYPLACCHIVTGTLRGDYVSHTAAESRSTTGMASPSPTASSSGRTAPRWRRMRNVTRSSIWRSTKRQPTSGQGPCSSSSMATSAAASPSPTIPSRDRPGMRNGATEREVTLRTESVWHCRPQCQTTTLTGQEVY